MKKSCLISILALLFLSVTTTASAQWVTTQLTSNSISFGQRINDNGHVVWWTYNVGIFYYNGNTIIKISNGSLVPLEINNNGHVVWNNMEDGDHEIFYYDGSTTTCPILLI